ncbi:glycosyltransferase family 9 protein [Pontibacter sp. 172403-2]|uniref:glycosyltransferase family 9 protein n=1 Tax=Pontibacter rufus TaxID=2791028 RepID=UPI0018AFB5F2|nr:glycosyltransferase family 9 protein [Pontibacter sp. 172403-2]MBF9251872.1 glycosyltransferase family 9 protein [Pontibacter sp. 172403-2]
MKTILISRTDAIGDVVLTLPMCGWLKKKLPGCKIIFLGSSYTQPVVAACEHVDAFLNIDTLLSLPEAEQLSMLQEQAIDAVVHVYPNKAFARLAQKAGIPVRVGTRNRAFHWLTCNRLVKLSRKNSPLHESQLNMLLLSGIGINDFPPLSEMHCYTGLTKIAPLPAWLKEELCKEEKRRNIILHPKSKGSAREWGLGNFAELAVMLHQTGHKVYITGSPAEHEILKVWLQEQVPFATDLTGRLSLTEFISLAKAADGLVACSTGTLHIAAAVGTHALGIYPPVRPVHPGRWGPVGNKAEFLVNAEGCAACADPQKCSCMAQISADQVCRRVLAWFGTAAPAY